MKIVLHIILQTVTRIAISNVQTTTFQVFWQANVSVIDEKYRFYICQARNGMYFFICTKEKILRCLRTVYEVSNTLLDRISV